MLTQPTTKPVQWQDLKVLSEADLVLDIAQQNGWKDCEIFGHGDMITHPLESRGWDLIPADLYEYSIPPEGVARILQIMNAGVRIQGVIIADDKRKTNQPPVPARPVLSRPPTRTALSMVGKVLRGLVLIPGVALGRSIAIAGVALRTMVAIARAALHRLAVIAGVALRALVVIAGVALLLGLVVSVVVALLSSTTGAVALIVAPLLLILGAAASDPTTKLDPKLIVLVEDGNGGTAWVSVLTWFD